MLLFLFVYLFYNIILFLFMIIHKLSYHVIIYHLIMSYDGKY